MQTINKISNFTENKPLNKNFRYLTPEEIKRKYVSLFYDFRKRGYKLKLILLLIIIPASYKSYHEVNAFNQNQINAHSNSAMSHYTIILIAIGLTISYILIALTLNSMYFVNSKYINASKCSFKDDLFYCFKQEIPELTEYSFLQKIHPRTFYASKLFKNKYSDYNGDDWMHGCYNGIEFVLCELHVFNLFKPIFNGIFVRCIFDKLIDHQLIKLTQINNSIYPITTDFSNKYNSDIQFSNIENNLFISFSLKGYFFENEKIETINKIDKDVNMLKDIINVVKNIIDNNK